MDDTELKSRVTPEQLDGWVATVKAAESAASVKQARRARPNPRRRNPADLAIALDLWKTSAKRHLTKLRKGMDANTVGWVKRGGVVYVVTGQMIVPGYVGPQDEAMFRALNPKVRGVSDLTKAGNAIWPIKSAPEIHVTYVPTEKDEWAWKRHLAVHTDVSPAMQINPNQLAVAVFAVGPNARLYQAKGEPLSPILVRGDAGEAIVMPMRAPK